MKRGITAIATSLVLLSGAASAAETLKVDQMDTVTAAGMSGEQLWGRTGRDGNGRTYWFGHIRWHNQWWDFRCKDRDGKEHYGRVKDYYPSPDHGNKGDHTKPQPPVNPPANSGTTNNYAQVNISGVAGDVYVNIAQGGIYSTNIAGNGGLLGNSSQTPPHFKSGYQPW